VRFEATPRGEAADVVARLWSDALLATLDLPDDALLDRRKLLRRPSRTVASMSGDPALEERIAVMGGRPVAARLGAGPPRPDAPVLPPPPVVSAPGGTRTRMIAQALRGNLYRIGASGSSLAPVRSIPSSLTRLAVRFEGGRRSGPELTLELASFLVGQRGCLSTSTHGWRDPPWAGEIGQLVPGASPEALAEAHDRGIRHLAELGARFEPLREDDVLARLSWASTEECRALIALPDDALLSTVSTGPPTPRTLPEMAADRRVADRIEALVPRPQEGRAGA
jgi:hypothetical protein